MLPVQEQLTESTQMSAVEYAIAFLYQSITRKLLPEGCAGAEFWVQARQLLSLCPALQLKGQPEAPQLACLQVYQPGVGLNFHFDKDEHCMKDRHEMVHPELSSVLYLTGSQSPRQQLGAQSPECLRAYVLSQKLRLCLGALAPAGPTVILDQLFDIKQGPVPDNPTGCVLAWPAANRYCIFDGRLGHGVLDSPCQDLRATLLINFWRTKPQARPELLFCIDLAAGTD